MNIEEVRKYCISKNYSFETTPFDDNILVYKVGASQQSKMFALIDIMQSNYLILKCDPDYAIELRDIHSEIEPAFHMNKRHWNGVTIDANLSKKMICAMIDHSYALAYGGLSKKIKIELTENKVNSCAKL